jgi:hypothetical protein
VAQLVPRMASLEMRVRALIDDQLFRAYWDASEHFKTRDLVLVFNAEESDPLSCFARAKLVADPGLPESVRAKLCKPARGAAGKLKNSETAFWLFAIFSDDENACVAVRAKPLAAGGHA